MQKIIYLKEYKGRSKDDTEMASNNVAHGLIELGVARFYSKHTTGKNKRARVERRVRIAKAMKSPVDKMMRVGDGKESKEKKGTYRTK